MLVASPALSADLLVCYLDMVGVAFETLRVGFEFVDVFSACFFVGAPFFAVCFFLAAAFVLA